MPEVYAKSVAQYAEPAKAFLDAVARGDGFGPPSVDEALAAHEVVEAAYRSAATGGAVTPVAAAR